MNRFASVIVAVLAGVAAGAGAHFLVDSPNAYVAPALGVVAALASFVTLSRFAPASSKSSPSTKAADSAQTYVPRYVKQPYGPTETSVPAPAKFTPAKPTVTKGETSTRVDYGGEEFLEVACADQGDGTVKVTVTANGFTGARFKLKVRGRLQNLKGIKWQEQNQGNRKRVLETTVPASESERVLGYIINR